jgi:ATP-dependent exoDNAse (exonuclease V) alpha subunit
MKQREALDILKAGRNVYLTGAAGSGKTYVLNDYISYLKERGVVVAVTASTGIAATHIGGVTIHSWSGIGIKESLTKSDMERLEQKEYLWKRYDKAKVLIIDEVSMLAPMMLDSIEGLCRKMKRNDKPFGGMQVVLSGDFFQLPPIVSRGSNIRFIYSSEAWRNMDVRICYLNEQFRQKDNDLENILGEIRNGGISTKSKKLLDSRKNIDSHTKTKLYTHNVDVDNLNDEELAKLKGKEYVYKMTGRGKKNLIENLKKGILAPEILKLKKDAMVMFVKNGFDKGYVNGTLGKVIGFEEGLPIVKTFSGRKIAVSDVVWAIEEDDKILAEISQLPLRLAWAITVHKSQGMSLDAAEIDLSKSFTPGQGYVALSRLRSLKGLNLKGLNEMALEIHSDVREIDKTLLFESVKWQRVLERFSENDMQAMHDVFIRTNGGTIDKKEIAKNQARDLDKDVLSNEPKVATHEKTLDLVKKKLSIKEIAKKRGMTEGTILSHFEKLKILKNPDFKKYIKKYKPKNFKEIKEGFTAQNKENKLAPVHQKLKGKYSYEEIRLARLFLE